MGLFGLARKNEFLKYQSSLWLKFSIILLGFSIPSEIALQAGIIGVIYSSISVFVALLLGFGIIKLFNLKSNSAILINIGTAICGASAIGSISQIIESDEEDTSISLVVVLLFNTVAIFLFPAIGQFLQLNSYQFGIWSAVAIHDTSSVSTACANYSNEALSIGITIKLIRTLWLIPISFLLFTYYYKSKKNISYPWFILFFSFAIIFSHFIHIPDIVINYIQYVSKHIFFAAIFIMASGVSTEKIKKVNSKLLLFALLLWLIICTLNLMIVKILF